MANDVIDITDYKKSDANLPVTQEDVDAFKRKRVLLKQFVESQLIEGIDNDYAKIPGTNKKSLLKPGAEKLEKLFGLGHTVELVDKELDRKGNFAMFTYKARVYMLSNSNVIIAEMEGSCNSQEKKYKERAVYKNGQRQANEETPVCDILNTLQKMAQKRAFVGALIAACAASDYLSQDIETKEDLAAHGMNPDREAPKQASVSIPKVTTAHSRSQENETAACPSCSKAMMVSKYNDAEFYCTNCKVKKPRDAI